MGEKMKTRGIINIQVEILWVRFSFKILFIQQNAFFSLKYRGMLLFSVLDDIKVNHFGKTRHLKTSPWILNIWDGHFSLCSVILQTSH